MTQNDRIRLLNNNSTRKGKYVLYWMQASQRTEYNHSLEYAINKANSLNKPVVVFFGINDNFPEANERHYAFMIEGLQEIKKNLESRGIIFVIWHISPDDGAIIHSKDASLMVVDRGYLKIQRKWRNKVANSILCPFVQVESDVIVPVESASFKEEFSAATFRPKIKKKIDYFLQPVKKEKLKNESIDVEIESFNINNTKKTLDKLKIDRSVKKVDEFKGGTSKAKKLLKDFIKHKIDLYHEKRNDPSKNINSNMSPYLHFGQISPIFIALTIGKNNSSGTDDYLDELIVRRELSINHIFYNQNYDSIKGLPNWAIETLNKHGKDKRTYEYSTQELENADTHDPYWNAAQNEMIKTGKMHGYMRMYWGKKILEWMRTPEDSFKTAIYLNNKYELDGRDPNGFTGVAWCFGKHDHPWRERPIFGKIRYMNQNGLKRKFDIDIYEKKYRNI